jgi:hypothetical protein
MLTSVGTEGVRWQQKKFLVGVFAKTLSAEVLESEKVAHILGYLFTRLRVRNYFDKILCDFFANSSGANPRVTTPAL